MLRPIVKTLLLPSFILLYTNLLHAQIESKYLRYFPDSVIQKATLQSDLLNYSPLEKEVFLWTNLVRMAPQQFSLLVDEYAKNSSLYAANNPYVISLKKDLKKRNAISTAFNSNPTLKKVAQAHADYGKKTGKYGHQNIQNRFNTVFKETQHTEYAENCSYHYTTSLDAFISLLIDDKVKDLGHRKTILDPKLTYMGVGIAFEADKKHFILVQSFSAP